MIHTCLTLRKSLKFTSASASLAQCIIGLPYNRKSSTRTGPRYFSSPSKRLFSFLSATHLTRHGLSSSSSAFRNDSFRPSATTVTKPVESDADSSHLIPQTNPRQKLARFVKSDSPRRSMKFHFRVVTTPTSDTPGTLLYLHFDDRRYLVGAISEGSSRSCTEEKIRLRSVSHIILTGQARWSKHGGMMGMILGLADVKGAGIENKENGSKSTDAAPHSGADTSDHDRLQLIGPPNLNHILATGRRFIFRKGVPLGATEITATTVKTEEPFYVDENIRMWPMAILPESVPGNTKTHESAEVMSAVEDGVDQQVRRNIVHQMFNSDWHFDKLVSTKLSTVDQNTPVFVRDPGTKSLEQYKRSTGSDAHSVTDVLVREPWPAIKTERLPPTKPAMESLSYIIRGHTQRGKFLPAKAIALKVPKGPLFSMLTKGQSVENSLGETITPEMVLESSRPGAGVAILDIPTIRYIEPLLARPEWISPSVMEGVGAFIWILGRDVGQDHRIREFQSKWPKVIHMVASPDYCKDSIALIGAAREAVKHNLVDGVVFPPLRHSTTNSSKDSNSSRSGLEHDLPMSRMLLKGQTINVQPDVTVSEDLVIPPLDIKEVRAKLTSSYSRLSGFSRDIVASPGEDTKRMWNEFLVHGDVQVTALGTASSMPGKSRNVSGTLIKIPQWGSLLLDCGEGTLNTMRRMYSPIELDAILSELNLIWISHLHADHHLGITSIIQARNEAVKRSSNNDTSATSKLTVISDGPMLQWLHEYATVEDLGLKDIYTLSAARRYDSYTELREILDDTGKVGKVGTVASPAFRHLDLKSLEMVLVTHCRGASAISIVFPSGFKLSYSGDCRPSPKFVQIGMNSHLLVHEATFEDDKQQEAVAKRHSTSGEAIAVATLMQAKTCLLTHFSQRYPKMPAVSFELYNPSKSDGYTFRRHRDVPRLSMDQAHPRSMSNWPLSHYSHETIQEQIEESGLKVVFAFDYMRFKLSDVPRIEMKQPLLRKLYDLEAEQAEREAEEAVDLQEGEDWDRDGDGNGSGNGNGNDHQKGGNGKGDKKEKKRQAKEKWDRDNKKGKADAEGTSSRSGGYKFENFVRTAKDTAQAETARRPKEFRPRRSSSSSSFSGSELKASKRSRTTPFDSAFRNGEVV